MIDKSVSAGKDLMNQVKEKSLSLIIVALGFAAGAVWKDAIVAWLRPLMENGEDAGILTMGALIVTVVVIVIIIVLTKLFKIEEKK